MAVPNGPWDVEWEGSSGLEPPSVGFDYQASNFAALSFPGAYMRIAPTPSGGVFKCWYLDGAFQVVQFRVRVNSGGGDTSASSFSSQNSVGLRAYIGTVDHDSLAVLTTDTPGNTSAFHTYTFEMIPPTSMNVYRDDVFLYSRATGTFDLTQDLFLSAVSEFNVTTFDLVWIALKHGAYATLRKWWCGVVGMGGSHAVVPPVVDGSVGDVVAVNFFGNDPLNWGLGVSSFSDNALGLTAVAGGEDPAYITGFSLGQAYLVEVSVSGSDGLLVDLRESDGFTVVDSSPSGAGDSVEWEFTPTASDQRLYLWADTLTDGFSSIGGLTITAV